MSDKQTEVDQMELRRMTAEITAAYVGSNNLAVEQIPNLISTVMASLQNLSSGPQVREENKQAPAVPIKRSVTPDYIVCLEDGKKLKMLKRHLRTTYNMTPEEYREKWGLPRDYPMVAPNYAAQRSQFAKTIGLGTTRTRDHR